MRHIAADNFEPHGTFKRPVQNPVGVADGARAAAAPIGRHLNSGTVLRLSCEMNNQQHAPAPPRAASLALGG